MKNKLRRSMTSVLLAASLLFSSQSVIAFADDGSKSDASDLSPVQESVETVVKDEQTTVSPEEPAKNGEEGEQEKPEEGEGEEQDKPEEKPAEGEGEEQEKPETETPETPADPSAVAPTPLVPATPVAPEMGIEPASIEGDGDYDHTADIVTNSPRVYKWSDWSFTNAGGQYRVILWTQTSNGAELGSINGDDSSSLFPAGTGKRVYTATLTDNNWVFAGWTTNLYHDNGKINHSNLQGIAGKWAFSKDEYKKTPYDGKSSSIQVNAILPWEGGVGINAGNKLYFTLCANFNPLVTVNYNNEQGSVTADNPHGDDKFEAEYAQDKVFTITTSSAYKPYVNNTECTLTNSDVENDIYTYTYTLPSVTDPTTLEVTFKEVTPSNPEKPTDPEIEELLKNKINVVCYTVTAHGEKTYGAEVEGGYTPSNEIKFDGTNYTYDLTINYNPYVAQYNDEPNAKKHGLVGAVNSCYVVLKWVPEKDGIAAHWALENNADPLVTIPVKCDIPFLTETDLAKGFIKFECLNNEEHDSSSTYLNNFVDGTFNIRYDAGKAIVTPANPVSLVSNWKSGHMYVKSNTSEQITFTYSKDTGWAVNGSDTITMYMLCGPTEEEVRDMNLELILDCITTNGRHNPQTFNLSDTNIPITISAVPSSVMPISDEVSYNVFVGVDTEYCLAQYNDTHGEHTYATNNPEAIFVLAWDEKQPMAAGAYEWKPVSPTSLTLNVEHEVTNPGPGPDPDPDPNPNPGGNGGDNDDDDDRYTGDNTVTRTINDDDVPLNDRPNNTTTIDDEDVPLADLPDDTVTIDDGEVPLKDNPSTGDSLPFAAMAAAVLSLGGVIVLNRKKK